MLDYGLTLPSRTDVRSVEFALSAFSKNERVLSGPPLRKTSNQPEKSEKFFEFFRFFGLIRWILVKSSTMPLFWVNLILFDYI
ncbi:MAG: hypothetical protein A2007_03740 [Verrucomicrobia bacterium GWC2_42_7]|nr:MAG: hypothetical protein A2007_03740 [Verrucomicrobia bacterium GWC2_42_7]